MFSAQLVNRCVLKYYGNAFSFIAVREEVVRYEIGFFTWSQPTRTVMLSSYFIHVNHNSLELSRCDQLY